MEGTIVSLAKHIEFLCNKNISGAEHISNALAYIDCRYISMICEANQFMERSEKS